ncbi:alpha-amylase family glycosyl hydrolase [Sphingomicrobium lutaoense]|uniref:Glycosidase n=1 Tax=Sphingomicrobium lutaoense TaxID=515949 RepID=A0A839YZG5_9SPHN|nr:alpha-amylase family glycosyl hydrolase [Sphingomicrobium lutaoense]MBB3763157.1 glycosidase [Sphingomicrobium lutaoense]
MKNWIALALCLAAASPAAAREPRSYYPGREHVEWSRDAVIYQINTRQFSEEGTIDAARAQLPRLAEMGVDILWLMPIHPIGEEKRKGSLGSPYSIRDYKAVRDDLGSMEDFKAFVDEAHGLGMKVILDWVANHTAWDHPWVSEHPDWYQRTRTGGLIYPFDWTDIVVLDYENPELRAAMKDAMRFWVEEAGIDGYRADVAGFVPPPFWDEVRAELEAIKPVWLLAEYEGRDLHDSFDATYFWEWEKVLRKLGKGEAGPGALWSLYDTQAVEWPSGAQRMIFTSNHDENTWAGTAAERLGPALPNAFTLLFTAHGIPLIYNGQEAGLAKRLEFFEKDPIEWRDHPNAALFNDWIAFRDANPALHNAPWGGPMVRVPNSEEAKAFTFVRSADGNAVFVAQNYSDKTIRITLGDMPHAGTWVDKSVSSAQADGDRYELEEGASLTLDPWSSIVAWRSLD